MSQLDDLIKDINPNFKLNIKPKKCAAEEGSASEVLFHLPLITLTLLICAANKVTKVSTENAAQWISGVYQELYSNFIYSPQQLRLSSALRKRTVEAIVFLESMGLIVVNSKRHKLIELTDKGKKFLTNCRSLDKPTSSIYSRLQSGVSRILTKGWSIS